ncbi:hypothetical protein Mmc1_3364 [Magnetococcus marinus MC-1]|uniref:Uncharacterized protein n=1 Tax=Magnetococcus marinus (strain ATCC BAA-1437 / JCM 17883 / MC-1) TaxID=156889 RepID=A0LD07_MAGMM|nr:hypothetical protein [Magnetococcus marinus]ABK45850.1 hypothetical protein Mmc1_3364 [Magnetococcus marinus MC-1]
MSDFCGVEPHVAVPGGKQRWPDPPSAALPASTQRGAVANDCDPSDYRTSAETEGVVFSGASVGVADLESLARKHIEGAALDRLNWASRCYRVVGALISPHSDLADVSARDLSDLMDFFDRVIGDALQELQRDIY